MKAVLFALNSSYVHTNLAIWCLKNHVENKAHGKHEIVLLEKNLKDKTDEVLHALYKLNADLYGFSCYIFNIKEMLYYAKNLKILIPNARIIFGGPEVSFDTLKFKESNSFIDFIITNEAESSFLDLLEGENSKEIINGKEFGEFIDQGIQYASDEDISGNIAYYESSRGCPFKCSYCLSSNNKGVRAKTAAKTLSDLLEFEKFKKIEIVKFVDRTFNYNISRANRILRGLIEDRYTKTYHMEIRPELFNNEMFEILKIYPKDKLQMEIGIQSTNHKTLEAIDRPSDIRKAIENMKMLRGFGNIKIHADLIAGLPFDDISAISKSFDDIFHVCDELQLGFLKLLKGTKIRDQEAEYSFKYNEEAPYEVYENCFLSFDEIFLLKRIAALTERYKNSRHFINSCEYIISFSASAFSFFKGLDKFINCNISAVSQHEAFRYLYEYSSFFIKKDINENDWDVFITGIQKDYMKCLNRKAPKNFI